MVSVVKPGDEKWLLMGNEFDAYHRQNEHFISTIISALIDEMTLVLGVFSRNSLGNR